MLTRVCRFDELADGRTAIKDAGERRVLLVRVGNAVYATEPRCPHARSVLGPGRLAEGNLIECPMHGALFDPADGTPHRGPTCAGLETYPTRLRDGVVLVDLDAARPRPGAPPAMNDQPSAWGSWTAGSPARP